MTYSKKFCRFFICICFSLLVTPLVYGQSEEEGDPRDEEECFVVAEQMPRFPGCEDGHFPLNSALENCAQQKMLKFIKDSLRVPKTAVDKNVYGLIVLSFIVEKDGSLTNIKVLRGLPNGCSEAAVDVIKKMPRWIPARQRNNPVRCMQRIPIRIEPPRRQVEKDTKPKVKEEDVPVIQDIDVDEEDE